MCDMDLIETEVDVLDFISEVEDEEKWLYSNEHEDVEKWLYNDEYEDVEKTLKKSNRPLRNIDLSGEK